jgi:hypothetical protein
VGGSRLQPCLWGCLCRLPRCPRRVPAATAAPAPPSNPHAARRTPHAPQADAPPQPQPGDPKAGSLVRQAGLAGAAGPRPGDFPTMEQAAALDVARAAEGQYDEYDVTMEALNTMKASEQRACCCAATAAAAAAAAAAARRLRALRSRQMGRALLRCGQGQLAADGLGAAASPSQPDAYRAHPPSHAPTHTPRPATRPAPPRSPGGHAAPAGGALRRGVHGARVAGQGGGHAAPRVPAVRGAHPLQVRAPGHTHTCRRRAAAAAAAPPASPGRRAAVGAAREGLPGGAQRGCLPPRRFWGWPLAAPLPWACCHLPPAALLAIPTAGASLRA